MLINKEKIIEKIKNKKIEFVILIIILMAIIFFLFFSQKSLDGVVQKLEENNIGTETKLCYLNENLNKFKGEGAASSIQYIEIDFSKKPTISGFVKFETTEEASLKETFVGAVYGDLINIILENSSPTRNLKEQMVYKIVENGIVPSEKLEKVEENGVLMVKDILKTTFNEKEIFKKSTCKVSGE